MRNKHIYNGNRKTLCGWDMTKYEAQYAQTANPDVVKCPRCLKILANGKRYKNGYPEHLKRYLHLLLRDI